MTLKSIQEYGPKFQVKVLSSLLTHKEFLVNIYDILNEEDFNNQAHRWVVKEIIKYSYEKNIRLISWDGMHDRAVDKILKLIKKSKKNNCK